MVCRKTAAARPSSIRAASRKPRPAHNHTDRAFAAWPGVSRAFLATGPGLGFCSCNPLKPRQRTRAWPRFRCKNRSEKRPPENASIARFQGLCRYRIRSEIKAVFGAWVRQCERARRGRLRTENRQLASGLPEKRRQPAAAKPAPIRAANQKPKARPAQTPPADACMAPVPLQKQEQKKTPEKRLHRTVSGALLLSRQERNRTVSGAWVQQLNGRGADGCGQKTGRLQVVCRKTAAARPASIRAESRKPKAESRNPKAPARPTTRAGLSRLDCGVSGAFPATSPRLGFCPPQTRSNPASGRVHGPGSTAKTGAKKDPPKTPPSHGFRGFTAIESGAKSRRFSGGGLGSGVSQTAGRAAGD